MQTARLNPDEERAMAILLLLHSAISEFWVSGFPISDHHTLLFSHVRPAVLYSVTRRTLLPHRLRWPHRLRRPIQHRVALRPLLHRRSHLGRLRAPPVPPPQEKTLRYFPLSAGKKNCYIIPNLPSGRYYIRTFTVYDNYDGKSHSPSFDVSVEGTLVFSWRSPWPEDLARTGAYSDLFAFVSDSEADVCFYSIATDPPVIGSLQLIRVDPASYDAVSIGQNYVLVNYGRFTCGSDQFGPGFSNDTDLFGRSWQNDKDVRSTDDDSTVRSLSTRNTIANTDQSPNYFPMKLYQTATLVDGKGLVYELQVDAKLDYLLWFHFAEIDSNVTKSGQRVFDILINGKNVNRIDIFKEVGNFAAYSWRYTVKNLSSDALSVKLQSVAGAALISGLENYALVPADVATVPEQVVAMRALKDSLRIPDRMGWNGDPCAPTNWDAWEGVTCHLNKNETALVISRIDLGSQGLKGFISDQISLLSNLASLNLSSNSLGGTLPSGLGQKSLNTLDLSDNQFSGSIPQSLATSNLQLVLMNNNLLEGQVPEELYSIGVHGGSIDLYGNKGLCGVPSLPDCPLFWENGGLSKKALAAKRNRYQRQKSLMLLEMESQHAKALTPFTPR
ncbi:Di-glucose binding protein with Leucine-rich repeat domain [Prunus dulcis]|uniref:Di-glucose binding protein with Leucine-rich repeat domain n=1 Tax=Prunus dulcis TaxID=3755 RepID=A0A4Y1QRG7_PRUDU|nr:Di-glucose binding protein with Leucine-rich repeat domain [Prunus dulcis]